MTGLDHEHSAAVEQAACWWVTVPLEDRPRYIIEILRERFGLSMLEACEACALAQRLRNGARIVG